MDTRFTETPVPAYDRVKLEQPTRAGTTITAVALIGLGLLFLLARFVDLGVFILPILALAFIVWGISTRNAGLMIPGGILAGIGLGVIVMESAFVTPSGDSEGGIFLLCFALGWFSIVALTAIFTDETHWWPAIPGLIMGVIGSAILFGGAALTALEMVGNIWPVGLILVGLYLLLRRRPQTL